MKASELDDITVQTIEIGLDAWHLYGDGTVMRAVRGGDGPEPTPPTPPPAPAPAPAPDLTALQAAIDQAKTGGATEATTSLLKALGFDKLEDAQAWVTAKRADETAQLTEVERREREAEERERAAQAREAEAATLINRGVIRNALQAAGVDAANLDDAEGLVQIAGDVTAQSATTAIEALKAKPAFASLFTATPTPTPPPGPTPPTPPTPTPTDAETKGRERAKTAAKNRAGATREDLLASFAPQPSPFATTSN